DHAPPLARGRQDCVASGRLNCWSSGAVRGFGWRICAGKRANDEADTMHAALKISEGIRRLLEVIALTSGWLLVIMACVTTFDVVARKFGMQLPYTKLQELEWHFHAAIFSLWMGYCYTINAHPRVDTFTETMSYRNRAWIELAGCLLLALPYMALVAYY